MSLWVLIAAEPELPDVVCPPNAVLSVLTVYTVLRPTATISLGRGDGTAPRTATREQGGVAKLGEGDVV